MIDACNFLQLREHELLTIAIARMIRLLAICCCLLVLNLQGAQAAGSPAERRVVDDLTAQFAAQIVRERKLATERELDLLGRLDARDRAARKLARDLRQSDLERGAAERALAVVTAERNDLTRQILARDQGASLELAQIRQALSGLATESPELLAAMQRFADGERVEADATVARIHAAMDLASQQVADAQKAARRRQRAAMTRSMVAFGERAAADERALLEDAQRLDPTFSPGWVRLSELYGMTGRSEDSIRTAREAIARAETAEEKFYALRAFAKALAAEGDEFATAEAHSAVVDMGRSVLSTSGTPAASRELATALAEYGTAVEPTRNGQKAALAARQESIAIQEKILAADPKDIVGARKLASLKAYVLQRIDYANAYPEDELGFYTTIIEAQPENFALREPYRIALRNAATAAMEKDNPEEFRRLAALYIAELRREALRDTTNWRNKHLLARGLDQMANYEWRLSQGKSGLRYKLESLALLREVWAQDGADDRVRRDLDGTLDWFVAVAAKSGDHKAVDALSLERVTVAEEFQKHHVGRTAARTAIFWAMFWRADALVALGNTPSALHAYEEALGVASAQFELGQGRERWPQYCCDGGIFMSGRVIDRLLSINEGGISVASAERSLAAARRFDATSTDLSTRILVMKSLNVVGDSYLATGSKRRALMHYRQAKRLADETLSAMIATGYKPNWQSRYVKEASVQSLSRIALTTGRETDRAAAKIALDAFEAEYPRKRASRAKSEFYDPPIFLDKEPPQ